MRQLGEVMAASPRLSCHRAALPVLVFFATMQLATLSESDRSPFSGGAAARASHTRMVADSDLGRDGLRATSAATARDLGYECGARRAKLAPKTCHGVATLFA